MINFSPVSALCAPFLSHTLFIPAPHVTRLLRVVGTPSAEGPGLSSLALPPSGCRPSLSRAGRWKEASSSPKLPGLVADGSPQRCPGWPEICLKLELRCVCAQQENKQDLGSGAAGWEGAQDRAQSRRALGACLQLQEEEEEGSRERKVWQQDGERNSSSARLGKRPQASGCLAMALRVHQLL